MSSPLRPGVWLSSQDLRDTRSGGTATAGEGLDRARSFESLLRPPQQPISAASSLGRGDGWAAESPKPPALERLKDEEGVRKTRSHQSLYWPGSEFPRTVYMRIRTDDEHRPVKRRKGGSGLVSSCSRSLEDLDKIEPAAEFMKRLAGLSEEDLGDVSQNTSGGETTEDELPPDPCRQTREQAFGPIELVVGQTCDCQSKESKESCRHHHFWRGIITRHWSMKLFHNEESDKEIKLPPDISPLSEENMERVSKISGPTVFEKI